jgi:phospholipid transport system substrate-binding protein
MGSHGVVSRLLFAALLCCVVSGAGLAAEPEKGTGAGPAASGKRPAPVDFAREATDKVFAILRDPQLQGDANIQKRYDAVRKEADKRFDWQEMARRSLGPHWRSRTEPEQQEFTGLFTALIVNTYLTTIERNLDAQIRYEGEQVEERYATVKTIAVTSKGTEVPVVYWLRTAEVPNEPPATGTHPSWLVYDVQIEGVSMVRNYRSQFNEMIVGSSYAKLIERLKAKIEDAAKERAEKVAAAVAEAEKEGKAKEDAQ